MLKITKLKFCLSLQQSGKLSPLREAAARKGNMNVNSLNNMKGKAALERRFLFDDVDNQYYDKVHSIEHNGNLFKFSVLNLKSLEDLKTEVSEKIFNEILESYNIITFHDERFSTYRIIERIPVDYYKIDKTIILVSTGEVQPGRYWIIFEGIYEIE